MKTDTLFIYQPGSTHIQGHTFTDAAGVVRVAYTETLKYANDGSFTVEAPALTLSEYIDKHNAERNPNKSAPFIAAFWEEVEPQLEAAQDFEYIRPWKEIDDERWDEMLNVLPPEKWQTVRGVNIFRMSEYYTSNITTHFAKLGGRYFERQCRTTEKYETLAAEVAALVATTPKIATLELA